MTSSQKWAGQADMLVNRIRKRQRQLRTWLKQESITCYRVYDRDIPEIPIVVDWYDGRLYLALYEKSSARDTPDTDRWLAFLTDALKTAFELDDQNIFVKRRRQAEGGTQYAARGGQHRLIPVAEGGLTFWVNLTDYVDTGLFLDHRVTRAMVREMSHRKRVLNLFAYTGAFSVYAAAGNAASVTTVDLSNTYLAWAKRNMAENGFEGARYRYVRDDVLGALTERRVEETYDLIVADPPTVSKSKRMARSFEVQRDHVILLSRLLERLSPEGAIVFSTNFKTFKLKSDALPAAVEEISHRTCPRDFQARPKHRCWLVRHL